MCRFVSTLEETRRNKTNSTEKKEKKKKKETFVKINVHLVVESVGFCSDDFPRENGSSASFSYRRVSNVYLISGQNVPRRSFYNFLQVFRPARQSEGSASARLEAYRFPSPPTATKNKSKQTESKVTGVTRKVAEDRQGREGRKLTISKARKLSLNSRHQPRSSASPVTRAFIKRDRPSQLPRFMLPDRKPGRLIQRR